MKLIIAEKPSVANTIATVLGNPHKQKAYFTCDNDYLVSWCFGHLVQLANPEDYSEKYKIWNFENLPILPKVWKYKVSKGTRAQFDVLKSLMFRSDVSEIICATDAGREGECIFRYIYNLTGCKKPVKRLWTSSLEVSAIKKGFENLKDSSNYDNLYKAGLARAKADWLIGMNVSRVFSIRYSSQIRIGRVMTPTLAMIVERNNNINNFVKEKFYKIDATINGLKVSSEKITNREKAEILLTEINGNTATVDSIKRENKVENPPKLYDLTTLQRVANRTFGYTAQQTLDAVQNLYESKLCTYPRTDSQYITDDMEDTVLSVIDDIKMTYSQYNDIAFIPNIKKCINNKKVTDHHAILPTSEIKNSDISSLPEVNRNVLSLLVLRLICASAPAHTYESVSVEFCINGVNCILKANGKSIINNGWKMFIGQSENQNDDNKPLPKLIEGMTYSPIIADISEHYTSPPKPFTEDTLLSAMETAGNENYEEGFDVEKKGLGTPATRAEIIEKLVRSSYIERNKKQLIPTPTGISIIDFVPDEVKSAKTTAEWETQLQSIEKGIYPDKRFLEDITNLVEKIVSDYSSSVDVSFAKNNISLGNCPHCGNEITKGKYGFYCKGKCGMNIAKVYGKTLSESQLGKLLSGQTITFTNNGRKTTVYPECVPFSYNGKSGFQWKTK